MVGLDNKIQIIDVRSGQEMSLTIEAFLMSWAHHLSEDDEKHQLYIFDKDEIKIRDLVGWTNLISITLWKHVNNLDLLRFISIEDNFSSILYSTPDQIFPIYDNNLTNTIGFHGEVVYNYKLKNIKKVKENELFRIKSHTDKNTLIKSDFMRLSEIEHKGSNYQNKAVDICTQSKFCNVNNIYIYAHSNLFNGFTQKGLFGEGFEFIPDYISRKRIEELAEDKECNYSYIK